MGYSKGEWKVRFFHDDIDNDFFVEAPRQDSLYGIEIMMYDYGDHNGYPREQRLADAKLIAAAPALCESLKYYFDVLKEARGDDWDKNPDHVLSKMLSAYKKATI